jgi:hypothetical protein
LIKNRFRETVITDKGYTTLLTYYSCPTDLR